MKKLLNQFNNFCYLRTSFDLKVQDLFETSNHREYLKCGTKFYKKSSTHKKARYTKIIKSIQ